MAEGAKFCPSCGTPAGGGAAARPDKEKAGNIVKCPNCGAPVPAMSAVCPECSHEFRNVGVSSGLKEFFNKIIELDGRPRRRAALDKAHFIRGAIFLGIFIVILCIGSYYVNEYVSFDNDIYLIIAAIAALVFAIIVFAPKAAFTEADNQKKTLIENFPIPNTKEDIIEFLVLASSKIIPAHGLTGSASLQRAWNKIWGIKCRQVYDKADILLTSDKDALATVEKVRVKNEKILAAAWKRTLVAAAAVVVVIAAIGGYAGYLITGGNIKFPEKVIIPPEEVTFAGTFSEYLKPGKGGVVLTVEANGTRIKTTADIEVTEDLNQVLEQEIQKLCKAKNWSRAYVTVELSYYSSRLFRNGSSFGSPTAYYNALLKIKPGQSQTILIDEDDLNSWGNASARKMREEAAQAMAVRAIELRLSLVVFLTYEPPNAKSAYETLELN
jgi:endogenous inhibitor of DNA gyrase (YacG/DUF329 family)